MDCCHACLVEVGSFVSHDKPSSVERLLQLLTDPELEQDSARLERLCDRLLQIPFSLGSPEFQPYLEAGLTHRDARVVGFTLKLVGHSLSTPELFEAALDDAGRLQTVLRAVRNGSEPPEHEAAALGDLTSLQALWAPQKCSDGCTDILVGAVAVLRCLAQHPPGMAWVLGAEHWTARLFGWGAHCSTNVSAVALELLSQVFTTGPLDAAAVRRAATLIADMSRRTDAPYFYKVAQIDLTRRLLLASGSSQGACSALEVLDPSRVLELVLDSEVLIRQRVIELLAEVRADPSTAWCPTSDQVLGLGQSLVAMSRSTDAASLLGAAAAGDGLPDPGRSQLVDELRRITHHALDMNKVDVAVAGLMAAQAWCTGSKLRGDQLNSWCSVAMTALGGHSRVQLAVLPLATVLMSRSTSGESCSELGMQLVRSTATCEHPTVLGRMLALCPRDTDAANAVLVDAVSSRLAQQDSDLREVAIEFVGQLFRDAVSGEFVSPYLLRPLAQLAVRKTCRDCERVHAVQACALVTLLQVGLHSEGIHYLADTLDIPQVLQQALGCSASGCVRRSALVLLQTWLASSAPEQARSVAVGTLLSQRETLAILARDGDWEVKRSTMMLAGTILKLAGTILIAPKESLTTSVSALVTSLDCCGVLITGLSDFDREVRKCSAEWLLAGSKTTAITNVQIPFDRQQLEVLVRENSPQATKIVDGVVELSQGRDDIMECY